MSDTERAEYGSRLLRGAGLVPVLLALLLPALACSDSSTRVFGPFIAEEVRPIEPATIWFRWYGQTEECVGTDGRFARIEWFAAGSIVNGDSQTRHDAFFRPPNKIFLEGGRAADENTIRHEMVHELLDKIDPDHTHDNAAFRECVSKLSRENGG